MIPPIANRFVAGETAAEAIEHTRALNARGVKLILNLLGEHYHEREPADDDRDAYLQLLDDIEATGLDACVSVKPSQIGLELGEDVFRENLELIVERAKVEDLFVWIDMEDSTTTDPTLDAFEAMADVYPHGVGVCVQANLERTLEDLGRLAAVPGKVRLVKGAYDEPAEIAYKDKAEVDAAYEDCLEYMFERFDGGIGVATHDQRMIDRAIDLHEEHGTDFEFQMLMGVRERAQLELARDYEVWQYAPYGTKWFSYFYRRVMERKENLAFALRAVAGS